MNFLCLKVVISRSIVVREIEVNIYNGYLFVRYSHAIASATDKGRNSMSMETEMSRYNNGSWIWGCNKFDSDK